MSQENTGFQFCLLDRGREVICDFAGSAVVEHRIPVTDRSRFPVMSVTKAFIGVLAAKLIAAGRLDLDAPVTRYLSDFPGDDGGRITIRMLLAHRSGLPHFGHPDRKTLYTSHFSNATEALSVLEGYTPVAAPGERYQYASTNYNVLAAVIEKISGASVQEVMRQRVLRPLKLRDTSYNDILRPQPNTVRGYSYVDIWSYTPSSELQQVPTWDFSYNYGDRWA